MHNDGAQLLDRPVWLEELAYPLPNGTIDGAYRSGIIDGRMLLCLVERVRQLEPIARYNAPNPSRSNSRS